MTWFKPHPEKPLREQLLEARDDLIRQISVLQGGPAYPDFSGPYMRAQADELKTMLEEIEAELARTEGVEGPPGRPSA
jgi:hypothetical protein